MRYFVYCDTDSIKFLHPEIHIPEFEAKNNTKPHYIKVNGEEILTASNIGIIDMTYTLGVTNEYYEVLVNSQDGVLPE